MGVLNAQGDPKATSVDDGVEHVCESEEAGSRGRDRVFAQRFGGAVCGSETVDAGREWRGLVDMALVC